MAYVPPNSTIKLLSNVPLDIGHSHTLWFLNSEYQYNYFSGKATRTFSNVSYVRKGRGVIKLQCPADQLYGCNYMMYQNTSYSNKWFYAFCYIEYVNDNTSQITFVIDHLQTWFFEMQLKQCYVEREHSTTDNVGDNRIPEGLETGEYVYTYANTRTWNTWSVFIGATFMGTQDGQGNWSFANVGGSYLGGIFGGLAYKEFVIDTIQGAQNVINYIGAAVSAGLENGIVQIFMMPSYLYDANGYSPNIPSMSVPKISAVDNYIPRNNKLLTYPYCFLEVNNSEGDIGVFRQEDFDSATCVFAIESALSSNPSIGCIPLDYKKMLRAIPEGIFLNPALACSYNTDLFKAYMAQSLTAKIATEYVPKVFDGVSKASEGYKNWYNDVGVYGDTPASTLSKYPINQGGNESANTGSISSAINAFAVQHPQATTGAELALTSMALGALTGAHESVYGMLSTMYAKDVAAPHFNGSSAGDFLTSTREKGFWFYHKTIRAEFAQIIDQYFDRFGYACHRIKVPNIHVRQKWTYTKTKGCEVEGNIPIDAKAEINAVFDSGITFWDASATVGDYTQSNGIIV